LGKVALKLGEIVPKSTEEFRLRAREGYILVVIVAHLGSGVWG
jgi:hypothetical protein